MLASLSGTIRPENITFLGSNHLAKNKQKAQAEYCTKGKEIEIIIIKEGSLVNMLFMK